MGMAIACVWCTSASAQPLQRLHGVLPIEHGEVIYTGTLVQDGLDPQHLLHMGMQWALSTYNEADSGVWAVRHGDKVQAHGYTHAIWTAEGYPPQPITIWHTITIQCRDGACGYVVDQMMVTWHARPTKYNAGYDMDKPLHQFLVTKPHDAAVVYPQIDADVRALITSLERATR